MATIGERIREFRESLGLSVDEFARALEVHRSSMYRYEESNVKEIREIPISVAIKIAKQYNLSLDWLAGLSDVKYRNTNNVDETYNSLSPDGQKEVLVFVNYIKAKENTNG